MRRRRPEKLTSDYGLPTSGKVLGPLVSAMGLDDPAIGGNEAARDLQTKTARRMFQGERVLAANAEKILKSVSAAIVNSGYLPDPQTRRDDDQTQEFAFDALRSAAGVWDGLKAHIESHCPSVDPRLCPAIVPLRLLVPHLAVQYAAILWLFGSEPPAEGRLPEWASEDGPLEKLRSLRAACRERLTDEEFAKALGLGIDTVREWFRAQPACPQDGNVVRLADYFDRAIPGTALGASLPGLRGFFAACRLLRRAAEPVGWSRLQSLALKLTDYARRVHGFWCGTGLAREQLEPEIRRNAWRGISSGRDTSILDWLLRDEGTPMWRLDLEALRTETVFQRIHECFYRMAEYPGRVEAAVRAGASQREAETSVADSLRTEYVDGVELSEKSMALLERLATKEARELQEEPENIRLAWEAKQRADVAFSLRDRPEAARQIRRACRLVPDDPELQFQLSAILGDEGRMKEAIDAAWLAFKLCPEWHVPYVAVGVYLFDDGRTEEAVEHLRTVPDSLERMSCYQAFHLGRAYFRLGDHAPALEAFEYVIGHHEEGRSDGRLRDSLAESYDLAAICALELGGGDNTRKGREYAKEAQRRGRCQAETLRAAGRFLAGGRRGSD